MAKGDVKKWRKGVDGKFKELRDWTKGVDGWRKGVDGKFKKFSLLPQTRLRKLADEVCPASS